MLEESGRGKSADRPAPFRGLRDVPVPTDKKLTTISHRDRSKDALGKIPTDDSARAAEKAIRKLKKSLLKPRAEHSRVITDDELEYVAGKKTEADIKAREARLDEEL
ncbi:MAG: hypothetical protein Q8Q13_00060 [bacterium]|nr:hypothetical protein [bacterium]